MSAINERIVIRDRNKWRSCCKNYKFTSGVLTIGYGGLLSIYAGNFIPFALAIILIALHKRIAKIW